MSVFGRKRSTWEPTTCWRSRLTEWKSVELSTWRGCDGRAGTGFRARGRLPRAQANQLLCVPQRLRRELLPRQHAADFAGAGGSVQLLDHRHGAALRFRLFDVVVVVSEGRDLWQGRDAPHLVGGGPPFPDA